MAVIRPTFTRPPARLQASLDNHIVPSLSAGLRFIAPAQPVRAGTMDRVPMAQTQPKSISLATLVFGIALIISMACFVQPAYADGLAFSSSYPEDGAVGVPTEGRFWVQYDHNIASVAGNAKLASMTDAGGAELPADKCAVTSPDYETQFGLRQYILFDVKDLDAGATYHIKIAAGVTAKNGSTCDEPVDIEFTTAKEGEDPIALAAPTEKEGGSGDGGGGGSGSGGGNSEGGGSGNGSGNVSGDGSAPDASGQSATAADGAIELTDYYIANTQGDDPRPTEMTPNMAHYAVLTFSKGIDYYPLVEDVDLSHLDENYAKVSLQKADGTRVEGVKVYSYESKSEERPGNIYVDLQEHLAPLSEYKFVVEPGLTTYSRAYASTKRFEVPFHTNADMGGGWTVWSVLAATIAAVVVCAGMTVQAMRRMRERRANETKAVRRA